MSPGASLASHGFEITSPHAQCTFKLHKKAIIAQPCTGCSTCTDLQTKHHNIQLSKQERQVSVPVLDSHLSHRHHPAYLPAGPRALQISIPTAQDQKTCSCAPWGSCIAAIWRCAPHSGFSQDVSCRAIAARLLNGSDLLTKLLHGICTKQGRQVSTLGIVTHAACFCRQGEECHCP